jgi:peptidoglycan/xylan/chitin deacetylase (PgdA/CDA1 family)
MSKPLASLSLDLDNQWSYMKTHGDAGWESLPSYLSIVVPRVLDFLRDRQLKITWFIVGLDAEKAADREVLREISTNGHEVGNHSYHHEPWLHLYTEDEIDRELSRTEDAIESATGLRPHGFRGPGFSLSPSVLRILARRGYRYDASTFPTFLGPLARAYYFATARGLTAQQKRQRKQLFGKLSEGLRPLAPYRWKMDDGSILEVPVTTLPGAKVPIHVSYLLYLATYSPRLARMYWATALHICRLTHTEPSLLLHPLDFLGGDDVAALDFFPAMRMPGMRKVALVGEFLDAMGRDFHILPLGQHADAIASRPRLPARRAE